ncbi:MAG: GNAT family N-acetyltransferase [Lactobacillus sp.]|jgi:ElaA protein|nr:GNAT family N-acetyltransferase [Lactobacillus sp.]MCH3906319.1 GNAT family N-acetyltransferase [Lactobacillus sp.]MCH3990107.1 GNAT family N-acetyltransferase [Lactobacillus sp.]MCH4069179.1 GNAT family N-acetyltransferase [Lactobacillus sp.]MCI1303481.1 GNAT family N-acetyltransferase [Lactobacillus sp.]
MWQCKQFSQLTTNELYQILYLRTATFVVAQHRIYQEVDNIDQTAWHLFKTDESGTVIAYARIFTINHGQEVSFGRVVTSPAVRGQGVGGQLLTKIMAFIKQHFPGKKIVIEAQVQVTGFYRRENFTTFGKPFIYKSTPHIKMVHAPLN